MTYDLTDEVKTIGSLNFEGNITPIEWFSHIRLPNNKPDLVSIILLSDIVYWYRPTTLRDEYSGKIASYRKKFKSDLLQKSYSDLEDLFGLTKDQIKKSLQRLEQLNLIKRIFRHISSQGSSLANVMFIQIFPEQISKITEKKLDTGIDAHISEYSYPRVCVNKPAHPGIYTHTYTETTTKITTNNSLSCATSSKPNKLTKKIKPISLVNPSSDEREIEMLKIWNEIIEENNETIIQLTPKRAKLLSLRLREVFYNDVSLWRDFCLKIASSKFLMGEVTQFKAQLDWTLKEENMLKVMENSYGVGDRSIKASNSALIEASEEIINDPIWKQTREELKRQLGEGVFKSWISKLGFDLISDHIAHFTAPTKFIKEWIINNYNEDIKRSFNANGINIREINIQAG